MSENPRLVILDMVNGVSYVGITDMSSYFFDRMDAGEIRLTQAVRYVTVEALKQLKEEHNKDKTYESMVRQYYETMNMHSGSKAKMIEEVPLKLEHIVEKHVIENYDARL